MATTTARGETGPLPGEARLREDRRAERRARGAALHPAALRHPETRGDAAALGSPAGGRWGLQVLGGDARPVAGPGRQAPGRGGRGSPAGLRRLRGHHPQGPVRRRHRADVGSRLLGAGAGLRSRKGPGQGRAEVRHGRRAPARRLGAGAAEAARRREAQQLAADQAPGRRRHAGRRRRGGGRGSLRGLGAHHGGHRRRQGQGSRALHPRGAGRARRGVEFRRRVRTRVAEAARAAKPSSKKAAAKTRVAMPRFVAPQLCKLVERPPAEEGWVHEIKFDGYRMQLRVAAGVATLLTRKGLDWTDKFPAIASAAARLRRLHDRRRGLSRSTRTARRTSPASRPRCRRARPTT